jgi:hypothetical protein
MMNCETDHAFAAEPRQIGTPRKCPGAFRKAGGSTCPAVSSSRRLARVPTGRLQRNAPPPRDCTERNYSVQLKCQPVSIGIILSSPRKPINARRRFRPLFEKMDDRGFRATGIDAEIGVDCAQIGIKAAWWIFESDKWLSTSLTRALGRFRP